MKTGYSSNVNFAAKSRVTNTPSGTGVVSRSRPSKKANTAGNPLRGKGGVGHPSIKNKLRPIG